MAYVPFSLIESYKKDEPIKLELTLCKPDYNRTPIQAITGAYDKQLTKRFGSVDEISFKINKKTKEYDLIKGDFILLVEFDQQKQYFIIKECQETVGKKTSIKNVVAYSYEYIFSNKLVRGWNEGQQPLSYMMNYVISQFPSWRIGIAEPDLLVIERTMEVSEQSMLEFLIDIQKKYLCILDYDTVNRTINIRKLENLGKNKGFVLSERNYANSIEIKPDYKEVVTRLRCYGKDNMTINGLNPTGQSYIETYEYYIAGFDRIRQDNGDYKIIGHSEYMSDDLCNSLLNYKNLVKENSTIINNKYNELTELQDELNNLCYCPDKNNEGLNVLQEKLKGIQLQIDALIRKGENDLSDLKNQESAIRGSLQSKQIEVDNKKSQIDAKEKEINDVKKLINIDNNLQDEQIKELDMFIKEKTWSDGSYFNEKELYEEGKKILLRLAQPAITFSVDVINYLRCINCSEDWEYITTGLGDIVKIEIDTIKLAVDVRLVEYTFSENSNNINMTFSNKNSLDDPSIYLKDLLKDSISTSTTISMEKTKYGLYEKERSEFSDYLDGLLDLSKKKAFAGIDQEVVIDERGILLTNTTNKDKQVKLIGDLIAFTNDGWNTSGTAISSEGVIGEAIYGKVIAGTNLTIENTSGSFQVDANGVTINGADFNVKGGLPTDRLSGENILMDNESYNGVKINSANGVVVRTNDSDVARTIKTTLNASDGIKIEYYDGSRWIDKFKVDSSSGDIIAHNMQLKGGELINSNGKAVINLDSGVLNWDDITINGKIRSTQIESLEVGRNVSMGANATISWGNIINKPAIDNYSDYDVRNFIEGTYIDRNSIWTIDVYADNIQGSTIVGKTIKTSTSNERIEMTTGNDITFYSDKGSIAGKIDYDTDGDEINELKNRIFIRTNKNYALKLESKEGISLKVGTGCSIWFDGILDFGKVVDINWGLNSPSAIFG